MERNDYKNKYLKYKQKYTNVLENMYGGEPMLNSNLTDALRTQPKAIYIVDEATYNKVRTLLSLGENDTFKTRNRHTNCIDMLIGISNKNVLKIIPMAKIVIGDTSRKYTGLLKIDGTNPNYEHDIPFESDNMNKNEKYFGKNKDGRYDVNIAKTHLSRAKSYFEACGFADPYVIKLGNNADGISSLNFVGKLYVEVPKKSAYSPTQPGQSAHPLEVMAQVHGFIK